ncbi:MAG TPA: 4Fe-4S dicluster domain-containing protein [Anaerolineales bacterium]|nr:4Fe-4S dicluster domain-containing protein [Anaerolineales bacterium]HRF49823.1 4Fe-4S dicluster domain-containing protein [Anaerolineales bacterium]
MTAASQKPQLSLDARLGLDRYEIDAEQSHIAVDHDKCKTCTTRPCLVCCPAIVYRWTDERVAVAYENCLECGTCQIACDHGGRGAITWHIPAGGFGIAFRYG